MKVETMQDHVQVRRSTLSLISAIGVTCIGIVIGVIGGFAARAGLDPRYAMALAFFVGSFLLYPFLAVIADMRSKTPPVFWRFAAGSAAAWLVAFPLIYMVVRAAME